MRRGFVATALLLSLAIAALILWSRPDARLTEAIAAVAAAPGPDAKELAVSLGQIGSTLLAARLLVALALGLSMVASAWLLRPFSRRVAVGMAAAALLVLAFAALGAAASHRIWLLRTTAAMPAAPEARH